jgi:hypothetical protein
MVMGSMIEEGGEGHHVHDPGDLVPLRERVLGDRSVEQLGERVADEAPLLVAGRLDLGDAEGLGREAADTR